MATSNQEAMDTFMSITGASDAVAVQKLEEHRGDLNQALNAYFREGDRIVVIESPVNVSHDIEDKIIRAATETSKMEAEGLNNPLSEERPSYMRDDDDIAKAVTMSLKSAEEEVLHYQRYKASTSETGASEMAAVQGPQDTQALNGRLAAPSSPVEDDSDDVDEQPLVRHRPRRAASGSLAPPKADRSQSGSPEGDNPADSGNGFTSEWGGISVMLEATMFGGIPETGYNHLSFLPPQQRAPSRPPSPSLTAQRLIREQQDDEYLASLQADRDKELKSIRDVEARQLEKETARKAFLEEEKKKEEEAQRKLEEEQELERQLVDAKSASLPDKAIELEPTLEKGTACMNLGEYTTAKAAVEKGASVAPNESKLKKMIDECNLRIAEEEKDLVQWTPPTLPSSSTTPLATAADVPPVPIPAAPAKPMFRHEFYQKPEEVVVTIFGQGIPKQNVHVDFGDQILSVVISVAGEEAYHFQPRLFGKIIPEKCRYEVLSTKVEICLAKAEIITWASLEYGKGQAGLPKPNVASAATALVEESIDRALLVLENKVGDDLFTGKYRNIEVCVKFLKYVEICKLRDFVKTRRLSHPNVIHIIGICTEPMNHLVVFEPISMSIHGAIHTEKMTFDSQTLMKMALNVADGMQYLHKNNIVLGDLAPSNLFINEDGVVKVFGYGLLGGQIMRQSTMSDDLVCYGLSLWEMITSEIPIKYAMEQWQKAIDEGSLPLQAQPLTARSVLEDVFGYLREKLPNEENQKLLQVIEICWGPEPTFDEVISFLRPVMLSGRENYKKTHAFFHYRKSKHISAGK